MKYFAVLALFIVGAITAPVSPDDAKLVRDSWHQVSHQEVEILANFFERYPQHQSRFPAFVGKELASLKDTAKFAIHATRIVSALSEVIDLGGNPETAPALRTVLVSLGSAHKRRGIPKESFRDFETALIAYLKEHSTWGDNVEAAWTHAIDNSIELLYEGY